MFHYRLFVFLAFTGFLSGLASFYAAQTQTTGQAAYVPGVIFGIALALFFLAWRYKLYLAFACAWIVFSTLSYHLAYWTAVSFYYEPLRNFSFFIAGCIGAFAMLLSFSLTIERLQFGRLLIGTLLGGGLALVAVELPNDAALLNLFLIWQTGMAAFIGWALKEKP